MTVDLPKRSPEEATREALLFELRKATSRHTQETFDDASNPLLWFHFTDWNGFFDLDLLINEECLMPDPSTKYQPVGDWHDKFPPDAYRLTDKGQGILQNPGLWVFKGQWTKDAL